MDAKRCSAEQARLDAQRDHQAPWSLWGPYLAERQWGTVREDYSAGGDAWDELPHDHARSRAYRWGEDGLLGLCDEQGLLCFAFALWNGRDPILKERLFGLTNSEGNHGEDVKELYYYLDATPTHGYLKALYKYPQREFPYAELVHENRRRGIGAPEYELIDTEALRDDRYFDVTIEYAKASPTDLRIRIRVDNRGPDAAVIHFVPQLWFRNTWSWDPGAAKPRITRAGDGRALLAEHATLGRYQLACEEGVTLLTDNETNERRLWGVGSGELKKDAFHQHVIGGEHAGQEGATSVRDNPLGTKGAFHVVRTVPGGGSSVLRLRLSDALPAQPFARFDAALTQAIEEADEFYAELSGPNSTSEVRHVQRQAWAGMIWSKQFFYYDVRKWLRGDPGQPEPPRQRRAGRNASWDHLNNADVISMPDKWEYPWFAAWDLAFHTVALARVDPQFAKQQLVLLTREWYMHPSGQLPAYEWAFGDVNPPVHAWAALKVYEIDKQRSGKPDREFLERVFHKLMLNFTWWVNRKDAHGRNVFQGGFLGLDNIGVFDRSAPLPTGGHLDQADGTSWMAMYALNLMKIALELAPHNGVYQDIGTKFFEHFLHIAEAMSNLAGEGIGLWHEGDGFFYDVLALPDGQSRPIELRTMVGLIPLFAVEALEPEALSKLPEFEQRLRWFLDYRPDLAGLVSRWNEPGRGDRRLLALLRGHRMKRVLRRMLDEAEFLSPFGIRALSKHHEASPYVFRHGSLEIGVSYQPAESDSGLFGGNSNWRGPVWFPVNFLIIESLRTFHRYYGPDFKVECPTGSGQYCSLEEVADELARRLARIFLPDADGHRPVYGHAPRMQSDPHFRDHVLFYEYFHGDTGRGVGASHQTGWTGLVAELLFTKPT